MKRVASRKRCLNCEVKFTPKGYRVQKFCSTKCTKKFSAHGRVPLREWNPRPSVAPNKTTQAVANAVVRGLKARKGVRQLAVEFGLSGGTIRRIRKDAAIEYVFKNRKCLYCEEPIPDTGRMDRRFCDDDCSGRHRRNLPTNCIECGTKLAKRRRKYCSYKCSYKKRLSKKLWRKKPAKQYVTITKSCPECGTEFQRLHIEGQTYSRGVTTKKYCSDSCTRNAVRKRRIRKNNKLNARRKHIKSCVICGEGFSTMKPMGCWKKNKDMQKPRPHPQMKYCSVECRDKKWLEYNIDKGKREAKELSDGYVRQLLSSGSGRLVKSNFWSDDLVQAKKAEVRLARALSQQQQQQKG